MYHFRKHYLVFFQDWHALFRNWIYNPNELRSFINISRNLLFTNCFMGFPKSKRGRGMKTGGAYRYIFSLWWACSMPCEIPDPSNFFSNKPVFFVQGDILMLKGCQAVPCSVTRNYRDRSTPEKWLTLSGFDWTHHALKITVSFQWLKEEPHWLVLEILI